MKKEINKDIIKQYSKALLEQYDLNTPFQKSDTEQRIFNFIKNGDIKSLDSFFKNMPVDKLIGVGKMSKDSSRQAEYAVVSGITLATRYAIAGGLSDIEAYRLSDTYLQQLNNINDDSKAIKLFITAMKDFANRVNTIKIKGNYSLHISKATKYINDNIHNKLDLVSVSKYLKVSSQYLSYLFKKELNITFSEYVRQRKLQIAAIMLEQSDYSIQRITSILNFPSQSAFTTYFKNLYSVTPYKYRCMNANKLM